MAKAKVTPELDPELDDGGYDADAAYERFLEDGGEAHDALAAEDDYERELEANDAGLQELRANREERSEMITETITTPQTESIKARIAKVRQPKPVAEESLGPVVNPDGTPTAVTVEMLTGQKPSAEVRQRAELKARIAELPTKETPAVRRRRERLEAQLAKVGVETDAGQKLLTETAATEAKAKRISAAVAKADKPAAAKRTREPKPETKAPHDGSLHPFEAIDRPKAEDGTPLVRTSAGMTPASKALAAKLGSTICKVCGYGPTEKIAAKLAAGTAVSHYAKAL